MGLSGLPNINETVVVVADCTAPFQPTSQFDRRIDMTEERHVDELVEALRPSVSNVVVYKHPSDLIVNIARHKSHLIWPDWGGVDSRNRHALAPAICEAQGIRYVGGDAYTKIVCDDKVLSKKLITDCGLEVPRGITVYPGSSPELLKSAHLTPPLLVKPSLQGSSLGVTSDSLVNSVSEAVDRAITLLAEFREPIMIEEFIEGKEVSVCLIGHHDRIAHCAVGERYVTTDESFLLTRPFGYEIKKAKSLPTAMRRIDAEFPEEALRLNFPL